VALFILGAGSTRGASFVNKNGNPCLPPLDADFFSQLQRVDTKKHQQLISDVMADIVELFGSNFTVTMETVFTTLEHTIRMLQTTGNSRAFNRGDLLEKRDRLIQAVGVVLKGSLTVKDSPGAASRVPSECEYHKKLVSNILQLKDDIVSFNYDCLIDNTLMKCGDGKWNSLVGYGLQSSNRHSPPIACRGFHKWQPTNPSSTADTIHLYKLHGSLHFQVKEKSTVWQVLLKERPYTKQKGTLRFTIIPPEWHKQYDKGIFAILWKKAAIAVRTTKHLVFIGYSAPLTDLHSTSLLRTSIHRGSLRSLVIVNPDQEARRRIRGVLQRGLSPSTRVLSFENIKEFSDVDRKVWEV
jgi:hypothetical protein